MLALIHQMRCTGCSRFGQCALFACGFLAFEGVLMLPHINRMAGSLATHATCCGGFSQFQTLLVSGNDIQLLCIIEVCHLAKWHAIGAGSCALQLEWGGNRLQSTKQECRIRGTKTPTLALTHDYKGKKAPSTGCCEMWVPANGGTQPGPELHPDGSDSQPFTPV